MDIGSEKTVVPPANQTLTIDALPPPPHQAGGMAIGCTLSIFVHKEPVEPIKTIVSILSVSLSSFEQISPHSEAACGVDSVGTCPN